MEDDYEYRYFYPQLPRGLSRKEAIRRALQPIGDDAWEITQVSHAGDPGDYGRRAFARRPHYGTPGPSSWEYAEFDTYRMPHPNWDEHIASRGWQKIPGVWYQYIDVVTYLYKRTDVWRGTDDGDIMELLSDHGDRLWYHAEDPRETVRRIVKEILDAKWQLSVEAGYDVGTQRAVESWLSSH